MSYELYMKPAEGEFARKDFYRYFEGRSHYQVADYKRGNSEAWYQNEDTGVYFSFSYRDPNEIDPELEGEEFEEEECVADEAPVSLNINYCRPAFFGLEAERELSAFVNANSMLVLDPQADDTQFRDYSAEGFHAEYIHGNASGHQMIAEQNIAVDVMPQAKSLPAWEWNYGRQKLQESVGEEIFVPKIVPVRHQGKVATAVVWPDAISTLIPETDLLLVVRDDLAPRRFFRKTKDITVVHYADFKSLIHEHKSGMVNGACQVCTPVAPAPVTSAIKSLKPGKDKPEVLEVDKVLDQDTFDQIHNIQ